MIICFSGTGNSLFVAEEIAKLMGDSVTRLEKNFFTSPKPPTVMEDRRDIVIWVFPTYSWGVPPVVARAIDKLVLECEKDAFHWMVTTCGDDVGLCDSMWRKMILAKGYNAAGTFSVRMPNTYVCMKGFDTDPQSVELKKIEDAPGRIAEVVETISAGKNQTSDIVRGGFPWIKTRIIYPWFKKYEMNPRKFSVDKEKCIHCGKCALNCPLENIEMRNGFPERNSNCAFCLRCYHICPTHSVDYNGKTVGKGQYTTLLPLVQSTCESHIK